MNFDEKPMKFVVCPECGKKVPRGDFCIYCGVRLKYNAARAENLRKTEFKEDYIRCPRCGGVIRIDNRYCWYCGAKIENYSSHSSS